MTVREVRFAVGAAEDLVQLLEFLAQKDVKAAERALAVTRRTLLAVAEFPHSCRKASSGGWLRECVIPFRNAGYVAAFEITDDHILVLAVRHQREDDYH